MILRVGFQTFEFQQPLEAPKTLYFASREDALNWLKQIGSLQSDVMARLREYAARSTADPEFSRLSDEQALERLATLLHLRRIIVVAREQRTTSGHPGASNVSTPPAFPLSERSPRAASVSSRPPTNDPPTFAPNLHAAAQAQALVAAAVLGKPFCPE